MTKISPQQNANNIALIGKDITYIRDKVGEIDNKLEAQYVTRYEFEPIKKIVYGLVGLFLTAVVVAILKLILQ